MTRDAAASVEASFHRLLDGLPSLAVQGFDRERRVFHWNAGSERLFGWTAEQALGRRIDELVAPAAQASGLAAEVERWIATGLQSGGPHEALLQHRDGGLRPVSYSLVAQTRDDGSAGYYCLDMDLRPREQARLELDTLRERLQHVLEGTQDGVWDWDIVTDRAWFSPRFQALLGYGDEAGFRSGFRFRVALHPDDHGAVTRQIDDHLYRGGPPFDAVYRLRTAQGAWAWVHGRGRGRFDASGRAVRFSGAIADAQARVRAEQALRESEQRFRDLTTLSSDWYWETDAEHRFTTMAGRVGPGSVVDPDVCLGRCRWELPGIDMPPGDWVAHRAQLDRREPFRDFEVRRRGPDGRLLVFLTSGLPRFDEQGGFLGYRGVGRDRSAEFHAAVEREALAARLRDAQKLEAVGTLAGGIAHDLNNVLGAILGNLALARGELAGTHPAWQRLSLIERSAQRARGVVQQILAFSRQQPTQTRRQWLRPVVEEALELLRATLPAEVELRLRLSDRPLPVDVDAAQMHQVVMNLCINAWQAVGPRAGWIEVGLQPLGLGEGDPAPLPGLSAGDWAHLWVRDNGCGIAPEVLPRVFDPFFTTKAADEGTGLGLSVVHGIVAAHGGAVGVDSRVGEGATFHVCLPVQHAAAMPEAEAPAPPPARGGLGRHVLLVDDDEVMGQVAAELLRAAGFTVSVHTQATTALVQLREQPVDVVVTDLHMPGVSGVDFARLARGLRRDLPVIVSSGYLSDERRDEALRAGASGFVRKERVVDELVEVVRGALSG
ncbi:MAG: PAS domain-containing protein [Rubrivivax sp.]|nr:PAS domain-containing protein [Rubrivivax sp.]